MIKHWSFASLTLTEIDRVQHLIYGKYKDVLQKLYKILDKIIGKIIGIAKRIKADVVIVSDHGFEPLKYFVHIMNLGLLKKYTCNPFSTMYRVRNKVLQRLVLKFPVPNYVKDMLRKSIVSRCKINSTSTPIIITCLLYTSPSPRDRG